MDSEFSVPVVIRPEYGKPGILMAVKNESGEESHCAITLDCTGREYAGAERKISLKSAAVTDLQGNVREKLKVCENKVSFVQNPFAVTYLNLILE